MTPWALGCWPALAAILDRALLFGGKQNWPPTAPVEKPISFFPGLHSNDLQFAFCIVNLKMPTAYSRIWKNSDATQRARAKSRAVQRIGQG